MGDVKNNYGKVTFPTILDDSSGWHFFIPDLKTDEKASPLVGLDLHGAGH